MAGWITELYNLSVHVLRARIIEIYLTHVHIMLQLIKHITVFMHGTRVWPFVDCVIVIVYTLHTCLGSFRTSAVYSTLGYQEKATETV